MKIVEIAFILLVFNFCMGIAAHAQLTEYPIYYENELINNFNPDDGILPDNVSTSDETEQYAITMDVFSLILSVTDFGWLYYMIPDELDQEFVTIIFGIQAIVGFFYVIALVELFVKQTKLLGGGS
jgi:hypothetical protein